MASPLWVILSLMTSIGPESKITKLPRACLPEHYEIKIDISKPDGVAPEVSGSVQIRVNCILDSNNLTLNWKRLFIFENDLSITSFDLKKPSSAVKITKVAYQSNQDHLVLNVGQTLKKGSKYVVSINFSKLLGLEPTGLYKSFFYDSTGDNMNSIILTNMYPMNARSVFPCYDEPDLKATFNLTLVYNSYYGAMSNLKLVEDPCAGYLSEVSTCRRFSSKEPIAPYQLAFSINDYSELFESDFFKLNIEAWTSDRLEEMDLVINSTINMLQYYSDVLGVEYLTENLTLLTTAGASWEFSGGPGLLGVPSNVFDYERMQLHLARGLLRHMLSHQITLKSWTDLWIIEGLAWYFSQEAAAVDSYFAFDQCWQSFKYDALNTSVSFLANTSVATLPSPTEIGQKALCIFATLANFIGKQNFVRGTRDFIKKNKGKSVDIKLFQNSFISSDLKNSDLESLFERWLTLSGVPVLNVSRNGNLATFDQFQLGGTSASKKNYRPIKIVLSPNSPPMWLECNSLNKVFNLNDTPLVLIGNESSYLKVLYDNQTYGTIGKLLKSSNKTLISTRVQLLNDALDFAWMGYLNYSVALDLTRNLQNETEYRPWKVVLDHFDRIWYLLTSSNDLNDFKNFLQTMIVPIYKTMGVFNTFTKMSNDTKKLHSLLSWWACRLDLENCTASARKIITEGKNLSDFLLKTVINEGLGPENLSLWVVPTELNQNASVVQKVVKLIKMLRVAESHELIEMVLSSLINNFSLQKDDLHMDLIVNALLDDPNLSILTIDALLSLFGKANSGVKRIFVRKMAERISTVDEADIFETVIQRFSNDFEGMVQYDRELAVVRSNLEWLNTRRVEFLKAARKLYKS